MMAANEKSSGLASRSNASAYTVRMSSSTVGPRPYCAPPDWLYTWRYSIRPRNPKLFASRATRDWRTRRFDGLNGLGDGDIIGVFYQALISYSTHLQRNTSWGKARPPRSPPRRGYTFVRRYSLRQPPPCGREISFHPLSDGPNAPTLTLSGNILSAFVGKMPAPPIRPSQTKTKYFLRASSRP